MVLKEALGFGKGLLALKRKVDLFAIPIATAGALTFGAASAGLLGAGAARGFGGLLTSGARGAGKLLFGTPRRAATTLIVGGAATTSPLIRSALTSPLAPGKAVGEFVEKQFKDKPKEKIPKSLTGLIAGAVGGAVVGAAGAAAVGAIKKRKEEKALTGIAATPGAGAPIVGVIPTTPTTPVPVTTAAQNGKVLKEAMPTINVTSKPKINVIVQNAFS